MAVGLASPVSDLIDAGNAEAEDGGELGDGRAGGECFTDRGVACCGEFVEFRGGGGDAFGEGAELLGIHGGNCSDHAPALSIARYNKRVRKTPARRQPPGARNPLTRSELE